MKNFQIFLCALASKFGSIAYLIRILLFFVGAINRHVKMLPRMEIEMFWDVQPA